MYKFHPPKRRHVPQEYWICRQLTQVRQKYFHYQCSTSNPYVSLRNKIIKRIEYPIWTALLSFENKSAKNVTWLTMELVLFHINTKLRFSAQKYFSRKMLLKSKLNLKYVHIISCLLLNVEVNRKRKWKINNRRKWLFHGYVSEQRCWTFDTYWCH